MSAVVIRLQMDGAAALEGNLGMNVRDKHEPIATNTSPVLAVHLLLLSFPTVSLFPCLIPHFFLHFCFVSVVSSPVFSHFEYIPDYHLIAPVLLSSSRLQWIYP